MNCIDHAHSLLPPQQLNDYWYWDMHEIHVVCLRDNFTTTFVLNVYIVHVHVSYSKTILSHCKRLGAFASGFLIDTVCGQSTKLLVNHTRIHCYAQDWKSVQVTGCPFCSKTKPSPFSLLSPWPSVATLGSKYVHVLCKFWCCCQVFFDCLECMWLLLRPTPFNIFMY